MALFLMIFAFVLLQACSLFIYYPSALRRGFLTGTILFSLLLVIITELLSIPDKFTLHYISIFWGALTLFFTVVLLKYRRQVKSNAALIYQWFFQKQWKRTEVIIIGAIVLLAVLAFVQGVIYPPNIGDSLTYHMTRTIHWIKNASVDFFPTGNYRQLQATLPAAVCRMDDNSY